MRSIREAYREFLNTRRGADVYRRFKRILYSENDSLVTALYRAVLCRLPALQRDRVRLCDIGGGDGERITRIIELLDRSFQKQHFYELDFVEQSGMYAEDFASRPKPSSLTAHVHRGLFEAVSLVSRSYDVVFLIHSIFAFANGTAIEKVLSLMRPGGSAVVVSNAADSFLAGLKHLVDTGFGDARYEICDVSRSLDSCEVQFMSETIATTWQIEHTRWREDTAVILDWISLGRFESFDEKKKRDIDAYIVERSSETRTGRRFTEMEVVLVIPPL